MTTLGASGVASLSHRNFDNELDDSDDDFPALHQDDNHLLLSASCGTDADNDSLSLNSKPRGKTNSPITKKARKTSSDSEQESENLLGKSDDDDNDSLQLAPVAATQKPKHKKLCKKATQKKKSVNINTETKTNPDVDDCKDCCESNGNNKKNVASAPAFETFK